MSLPLYHTIKELSQALSKKEVSCVIVGARNPDQLHQNIKAIDVKLSPDIVDRLTNITEKLKQKLGPNADMWESQLKSRIH